MIYYRFSLGLFSLVAWHPASFHLMAHTHMHKARHIFYHSRTTFHFSISIYSPVSHSLCASFLLFPSRTLYPLQPLSFYYIYEWILVGRYAQLFFSLACCVSFSISFVQFCKFGKKNSHTRSEVHTMCDQEKRTCEARRWQ